MNRETQESLLKIPEPDKDLTEDKKKDSEVDESPVTRIVLGDGEESREIILIGTAHVSAKSAEDVKALIEEERPDSVCIELDPGRFKQISDPEKYRNTDIVKIIKEGRAGFFLANLILSNYQRKLAEQMQIKSGADMMQGIESAKTVGAKLVLSDRDISVTFRRIWQECSMKEKLKLLTTIVMAVFDTEQIDEETIEQLKSEDMLTAALNEIGESFSSVKRVLVDERDQYLAEKIRTAPGKKIVAVLGAAHVPGITKELFKDHRLEDLEELRPKKKTGKIIGWTVTILFTLMVLFTLGVNTNEGIHRALSWLLYVCAGSGLGALLCLANPLTILTSIVCAPLGAISPVLASGWFAGLMEAYLNKPRVRDFEDIGVDLEHLSGFWKNRVMKILLVVVFVNIGCAIGNIAGGLGILSGFFQSLV